MAHSVSPQRRKAPTATQVVEPSPRRIATANRSSMAIGSTMPGSTTSVINPLLATASTPSPTRSSPTIVNPHGYRKATPPPFHSQNQNQSPTQSMSIPPLPNHIPSRRISMPPLIGATGINVSGLSSATMPAVTSPMSPHAMSQSIDMAASPFTLINANFKEAMEEIGRSGVGIGTSNGGLGPGAASALLVDRPERVTSVERQDPPPSTGKQKSTSPRYSLVNQTGYEHQHHRNERLTHTPTSSGGGGMFTTQSPLSQSPPFSMSQSPKRRTPDRSLPLNEDHEEEARGRSGSREGIDEMGHVAGVDTGDEDGDEGPNADDVDATITPTNIAKRATGFYQSTRSRDQLIDHSQPNHVPTLPLPHSRGQAQTRTPLNDYYGGSRRVGDAGNVSEHNLNRTDWASHTSPSQSQSSTLVPQDDDDTLRRAFHGDSSARRDKAQQVNHDDDDDAHEDGEPSDNDGRESRAGHREDELDGELPDPNAGALRTIPEAAEGAGEGEEEEGEDTEGEDGQFTPRSPSTALLENQGTEQSHRGRESNLINLSSTSTKITAANAAPLANSNTNPFTRLSTQTRTHTPPPILKERSTPSTSSRQRMGSSHRLPLPSRHAATETAVPLAMPLSSWSWDASHIDPVEVEAALQNLQRAISPLAASRYNSISNHAQGFANRGPTPLAPLDPNAHMQNIFMTPSMEGMPSMDAHARSNHQPTMTPSNAEALQSLLDEHGYYGYTMGMASPTPAVSNPELLQSFLPNNVGNGLGAPSNVATSDVMSPMPRQLHPTLANTLHLLANPSPAPSQQSQPDFQAAHGGREHAENIAERNRERDRDRPGAPIPPTPYTAANTAAPTPGTEQPPLPLDTLPQSQHSQSRRGETVSNQQSYQQPSHLTHPVPYSYMRRTQTFPIHPQPSRMPVGMQHSYSAQYQFQPLAGAVLTDSTFSPASTPYPHPAYPYNPFISQNIRAARGGVGMTRNDVPPTLIHALDTMSMRSSPSHLPVVIPEGVNIPRRKLKRKGKLSADLGHENNHVVDQDERSLSTEPMETSPDSTDADETEDYGEMHHSQYLTGGLNGSHEDMDTPIGIAVGGDEDDEWVDEDEEAEGDLLSLEFHPSFVINTDKRKRRWEQKWAALIEAFQDIDRQTDATLLLLAAPSHSKSLHAFSSRSLRRMPGLMQSPEMSHIRSHFSKIASARRRSRVRATSLLEQLHGAPHVNGSPTDSVDSSQSREEELRRALQGALGSLSQLGKMYHDLEGRWHSEMMRLGEERECIEVLLRQAFGAGVIPHQA